MLQKEIYNNLFNKKANVYIINESKNVIFSKKFKVQIDYGREGYEIEDVKLSVIDNGNDNYSLIMNFKNKDYIKKIKLNQNVTYKIFKSFVNIDEINEFLNMLGNDISFEHFVKKLIREALNDKHELISLFVYL